MEGEQEEPRENQHRGRITLENVPAKLPAGEGRSGQEQDGSCYGDHPTVFVPALILRPALQKSHELEIEVDLAVERKEKD